MFNKWFRNRKKRIVPVEIVGRDEDLKPADKPDEKKVSAPPKGAQCMAVTPMTAMCTYMSKNQRTVRMVNFEHHQYCVHTYTFDKGYRFMRIVTEGYKRVYKVEWKDVLAILETPVIKEYKLKKETS